MARTAGSDGEKTQAALREAALTLIARHGFEAMTMRQLASEIGVQAAALYRYFPTWTSLLDAMSDAAFRDFPDLPAALPWGDQLLFWQKQVVALFRRHHGVLMLMGWEGQLAGPWLRVQMPVLIAWRQSPRTLSRQPKTSSGICQTDTASSRPSSSRYRQQVVGSPVLTVPHERRRTEALHLGPSSFRYCAT